MASTGPPGGGPRGQNAGVQDLTPTTVWRLKPQLVLALDAVLGVPVDSYLNGSQTWLTEDGPNDFTVEWRLHPVAGFRQPGGISPYDLWDDVVTGLSAGEPATALTVGDATVALTTLWDGLECYVAYDESLEPAELADRARTVLGREPDRVGMVDHDAVADAWERARGDASVIALVVEQLAN